MRRAGCRVAAGQFVMAAALGHSGYGAPVTEVGRVLEVLSDASSPPVVILEGGFCGEVRPLTSQ